jgi:hypothetical protein
MKTNLIIYSASARQGRDGTRDLRYAHGAGFPRMDHGMGRLAMLREMAMAGCIGVCGRAAGYTVDMNDT